jgi:phage terminase large subunit-like protein
LKLVRLPNPDGGLIELDYEQVPDDEKPQVDELLAEYERICESNPLWAFQPFGKAGTQEGGQIAFLGAGRVKIKMGTAGNQAGKTTVGVIDDLIQLCDRDVIPPWLLKYKFWDPPFRLRVATMDLGNHLFGVMIPKWQEWVPKDQLKGGSWEKAFNVQRRVLEFKNGSEVQFLSTDQHVSKWQGWTGDRVHFDEEPPPPHGYSLYEESKYRVMARKGQLMFTMTPTVGIGWTYDEIWMRRHDPSGRVFAVQWGLIDNPTIPEEAIKAEIAACRSEREYRMRILGDFVAYRGRVLEQFEDRHIIEVPARKVIQKLDVIVGIDPGLSKGGIVYCGFDRENRMVVFDEIYFSDTPVVSPDPKVGTVVKAIRMKNKQWGVKPVFYVIDPTARIRDMVSATESVMTAFVREGFVCVPGQNDREAGVLELWGRLEADPAAIVVSKACTNWLHERDRWLVAQDEEGAESVPKGTAKGTSFKTIGPDHLMDPTRYVAMSRAWGVAPLRPRPKPDSYRKDHAPRMALHGNFRREDIEVY